MFRIRPEQLLAFSLSQIDQANQKLVAFARQRFPTEFQQIDDSTILELVRRVRLTAGRFGIEKEKDVATFLDFTVMYGPHFQESAWAQDVLTCEALHGPDKMELLKFRVEETGVTL